MHSSDDGGFVATVEVRFNTLGSGVNINVSRPLYSRRDVGIPVHPVVQPEGRTSVSQ